MHNGLASRGPPGGLLGASWRPLGAQGGPRTAQDAKKAKRIDFVTFKMAPRGPLGVQFWQFLDRFGVNFGTIFRSILKQCWGPFGVQFGGTPCGPPGGPHTSRILPRSWREYAEVCGKNESERERGRERQREKREEREIERERREREREHIPHTPHVFRILSAYVPQTPRISPRTSRAHGPRVGGRADVLMIA